VVDGPFSGRTVVVAAGRDGDSVELVDGRVVGATNATCRFSVGERPSCTSANDRPLPTTWKRSGCLCASLNPRTGVMVS